MTLEALGSFEGPTDYRGRPSVQKTGTDRRLPRFLAVAALALALDGCGESSAQKQSAGMVLSIPAQDQPIVCSSTAQGARIADGRIALVFEIGHKIEFIRRLVPRRVLEVQFDSTGRLLHLSDTFHEDFIENITLAIDDAGGASGLYWRMTGDEYLTARAGLSRSGFQSFGAAHNPRSREANDADRVKAEVLGRWLWERRCLPGR